MEKMTIHRALAELKLIDSRIEKAISAIEPSGVMKLGGLVNTFYKKEDFEKEAKSKLQSVQDLITRKNVIKSAIVKANGYTFVTVNDVSMTIADAINFKAVIEFKKQLISTLTNKHRTIKADFVKGNENVHNVALGNAKIMLGKQDDSSVKPTDDDVKAVMEPFIIRNEAHLVDPLDVEKLVDKLQAEVDGFEVEVDAVLSEINAITLIEI